MSTATGVNRVILLGETTSEPVKDKNSISQEYSFAIDTQEMVKRGRDKLPHTETHQIKASATVIDPILAKLHKGCKIYLEGRAETTSSVDHQGIRRYVTSIYATRIEFPGLAIAG